MSRARRSLDGLSHGNRKVCTPYASIIYT